ncbi:hypothetical protein DFH08DRAFT_821824 [Mycena albidolilacea]|uniref:DUF6535 domain-containing protein n=1 Tax=Mycena albidolilacea TaxID=1033008 RepID=A0AAD6Z9S5_9AGAR|nr:hypothetical protein DFH08DRAFT_821824 [Mycena albidolilacea]
MASDERAAVQPLPDNPRPVSTTPSNAVPFPGSFLRDGNADARVVTDNERLINTLQECFTNLLKEQKEQTNRLIEELKPKPPPTTDKKTVFWNMYKTLADEHDKELLQRYSTDLDTALIFAGLFSAVDSAFIIQIQPEFQPLDAGLSLVTLIAQSLLYVSLGSTLLAALLAVLGKQWLMYYSAAGERGTIETRGLERQRKLDGLRKWKFDTVMQMFPLLLQFGLFLFAAALSVYLWKIHHVLASIVLGLSFVGTLAYISLLASAVISQDSPFQTPLVPLVTWLLPKTGLLKLRPVLKWIMRQSRTLFGHITAACLPYIHPSQDPLPHFTKQHTRPPGPKNPKPLFDTTCFPLSQEVPAVSWVLETSTDPVMLVQAADVAIDLQWPITIDVEAQKNRLWENFVACFDYDQYKDDWNDSAVVRLSDLRDGMDGPAAQLGYAYYTLCRGGHPSRPQISIGWDCFTEYQEVQNVINLLTHSRLSLDNFVNIQWILHMLPLHIYDQNFDSRYLEEEFLADLDHSMPTLDCSGFTDYLFCVYAFLSPGDVNQNDIVCMDKSSLPKVDGWVVVVLATGQLTQWPWSLDRPRLLEGLARVSWVYEALESAVPGEDIAEWDSEIAAGVSNLLLALYYYDAPPLKKHIHLIVKAISMGGHISPPAGFLLLQRDVVDWFQDPQLGPILQHASVWTFLLHWTLQQQNSFWSNECILLGHMLSEIPDWQPHLEEELCSWITLFFGSEWDLAEKYNSVLTNIWQSPSGEYAFITPNEEALGLTYAAVSRFWEGFDVSTLSSIEKSPSWLHCTGLVVLCKGPVIYNEERGWAQHIESTSEFKAAFSVPLQNSLVKVVAVARDTISSQSSTMMAVIEGIAKILEDLVNTVVEPTDVEKDWYNLRVQFDAEIDRLEESLQNIKLSASPVI